MRRCNLATVVLQLKAIGVKDVPAFDFIERPSVDALRQMLGQLDTDDDGRAAYHPKYAAGEMDDYFEAKRQALYAGEARVADVPSVGVGAGAERGDEETRAALMTFAELGQTDLAGSIARVRGQRLVPEILHRGE